MNKVFNVFWRFLFLGCISFGGPAAHIGYFQKAFVQQLKWLDQKSYANLLSLSQFLPGPGSSQLGFAIGMRQAGVFGGIAAFIGFTLPSFFLLYLLATNIDSHQSGWLDSVIHGLKLLAVVIVADACVTMYKSFCHDKTTKLLAALTTLALLLFPSLFTQITALLLAALFGAFWSSYLPTSENKSIDKGQQKTAKNKIRFTPLVIFFMLLIITPIITLTVPSLSSPLNIFNSFYQSGSMVFGGGHVVLPILQQTIGEGLSNDSFLVGYASAQAVPGPMFTIATFLGAELLPSSPFIGALIATLAIFTPGFLLLIGVDKAWHSLAEKPKVARAVIAINAAVVGLLVSALYQPIFVTAVNSGIELALVCFGFLLLRGLKLPVIFLVIIFILLGLVLSELTTLMAI